MNSEQSALYIYLKNPELALKSNLKSCDFVNVCYGDIFTTIIKISEPGKQTDPVLVIESIKIPGSKQLFLEIVRDGTGAPANIKYYETQITKKADLLNLKTILGNSLNEINSGDKTADSITSGMLNKFSSMRDSNIDHAYDSKAIIKKTIDAVEINYSLKCEGVAAGITTGIGKLDMVLGGFHPSDLVIVGARPAVGKTSFALTCLLNMARRGIKVGFISTEMSSVQVGMRLMSLASGIAASTMRDSTYTDDDWPRLTAGSKQLVDLPFYVYDKAVCTVGDISMQARAWKADKGLDILIVDYLTRLKPENGAENKTIAVGNIATDLKTLARAMDIPVVCLAQLNRQIASRGDKTPTMADLRDSGVIEQEADIILMLTRDSDDNQSEEFAKIITSKNRHGATIDVLVRFINETMEWTDDTGFSGYEYS